MDIIFLGHQTWYVEENTTSILIDPILKDSFGTKEAFKIEIYPPRDISVEHLQTIDAVFLSHEHTDHFDLTSLNELPRSAKFYVGQLMIQPIVESIEALGFEVIRLRDFDKIVIGSLSLRIYPASTDTAFWESRVYQIHIESELNNDESLFIAVDALLSTEYKDDITDGIVSPPKTVAVSNNSRIAPEGVFQSLENWANRDNRLKKGPVGIKVLHSILQSYLEDFPPPDNLLICGGGFFKKLDKYGVFPFSDQEQLANIASALSLDQKIYGLLPGQKFTYKDNEVCISEVEWIVRNEKKAERLQDELKAFIKNRTHIEPLQSVMEPFKSTNEAENALNLIRNQLPALAQSILLSKPGRIALDLTSYRGRPLNNKRLVLLLRGDKYIDDQAYYLNYYTARFEQECITDESSLIDLYPFGISIAISDYEAMLKGIVQIWDLVGVSIKSWFECEQEFDSLVPFMYSYYGENIAPELAKINYDNKLSLVALR